MNVEKLADEVLDALEFAHEATRHHHASACCFPFQGSLAALTAALEVRLAAHVEAVRVSERGGGLTSEEWKHIVTTAAMSHRNAVALNLRPIIEDALAVREVEHERVIADLLACWKVDMKAARHRAALDSTSGVRLTEEA